ncbi:MAG: transglycosylase SLT domain-containing protein [Oligoflexia bacterium]|nr:transglycosylase SLT domain-containing protein [Oligoflexia bacterium]
MIKTKPGSVIIMIGQLEINNFMNSSMIVTMMSVLLFGLLLLSGCATHKIGLINVNDATNLGMSEQLSNKLSEGSNISSDLASGKSISDAQILRSDANSANNIVPTPSQTLVNPNNTATSAAAVDPLMIPLDGKKDVVDRWIGYFTQRDRGRFIQHLRNGYKYRPLIESILKKYNLPPDLYYLGLIESGYNLKIKSRAKAVGPWQFMKGTAIRYGLKVNKHVDERRNIFKATEAAAQYLKDLFEMFSDWELAMAAYNAGEMKILRAIKKGKSRDYDVLTGRITNDENSKKKGKRLLPKETCQYLPKLVAVKTIEQNMKSFGLVEEDIKAGVDRPYEFESISPYQFNYAVAVNDVISLINMSESDFREYNPDIKGAYIDATEDRPFQIYLPQIYFSSLSEKLRTSVLPKVEKSTMKKVAVDDDDRKSKRSKRYHQKNKRNKKSLVTENASAVTSTSTDMSTNNNINNPKLVTYFVKRGDSLAKIAAKFGVSVKDLVNANSLGRKRIYPKQRLDVPRTEKI